DRHVLKLGFLREVDVVYAALPALTALGPEGVPLGLDLGPLGDDVSASRLLLDQLVSSKAGLSLNDGLNVLVANALDVGLLVHVVGSTGHPHQGDASYQQNS